MELSASLSDMVKKTFEPQLEADTEPAVMDYLMCTRSSHLLEHVLLQIKSSQIVLEVIGRIWTTTYWKEEIFSCHSQTVHLA